MKVQMRIAQTASGEYRAWCPPLPGCQVQGQSLPQAQERLAEAAQGYLASLDLAIHDLELEAVTAESSPAR